MRNLTVYTRAEAEKQLRAGEVLIPAGGISLCGYDLEFYAAANEEDFVPREYRLELRRKRRKERRHAKAGR